MNTVQYLRNNPVLKIKRTKGRFVCRNLKLSDKGRAGEYITGEIFRIDELTGEPCWQRTDWDTSGENLYLADKKYNLDI